jgi:hypothetical protein
VATLDATKLTLADWAKRQDPDGRTPMIAELLSQSNEVLEDAVFVEGNLPTGHRVVIRTGLPTVYWRSINQGVPRSKSTTATVDDSVGMLEAYAAVDKDLAELNGNSASFRLSEDLAFLEGMNQAQAQTLFYGTPNTDPRMYLGFAGRYSAISGAGNAQNVLSGGGAASANTSVWLVGWGENTCFCPFPKGSKAGLISEDDGILTIYDANGNPYKAYQTHYQWKNGLCVKDWRYVVRIANLNTADFASLSGTQAPTGAFATSIIHLMSRALDRIPNLGSCRPAFYMNRSVFSLLRRMAMEKSIYALALENGMNQFGAPARWLSFEGVPLRRVDQLLNTETTIV